MDIGLLRLMHGMGFLEDGVMVDKLELELEVDNGGGVIEVNTAQAYLKSSNHRMMHK